MKAYSIKHSLMKDVKIYRPGEVGQYAVFAGCKHNPSIGYS
jgi:hypothetical protein